MKKDTIAMNSDRRKSWSKHLNTITENPMIKRITISEMCTRIRQPLPFQQLPRMWNPLVTRTRSINRGEIFVTFCNFVNMCMWSDSDSVGLKRSRGWLIIWNQEQVHSWFTKWHRGFHSLCDCWTCRKGWYCFFDSREGYSLLHYPARISYLDELIYSLILLLAGEDLHS